MTGLALDDTEALYRVRLRTRLRGLAPAYRALAQAVRHPIRRGPGTTAAPVPLDVTALDFLYHCDHEGHPGMIHSLLTAEDITRAAFGHGPRIAQHLDEQIPATIDYLAAQLDLVLDAACWSSEAAAILTALGEQVLARIDDERVRLDFDLTRRAAADRLAAIEASEAEPADGEIDALQADLATTPEEYAASLRAAIAARYALAAADASNWADYLASEIERLAGRAATILDLRQHSTAPAADCPWCGNAVGLTAHDPDLAGCAGCRRSWRISTGEAEQHFAAWRRAGWDPQPWRDSA